MNPDTTAEDVTNMPSTLAILDVNKKGMRYGWKSSSLPCGTSKRILIPSPPGSSLRISSASSITPPQHDNLVLRII